jgi:hypothetical protein
MLSWASTRCQKPETGDNATLSFSTTTLTFDTVFTTLNSSVRRLVVYNPHRFEIKTLIGLAGGKQSRYNVNVDGEPLPLEGNKEFTILPRDSIFIFVKVNIAPGSQNLPFLITDSLIFKTGTVVQDIDLLAYGQDAYFHVADPSTGYCIVARENETTCWQNDKPHVIYGAAVVDSMGTLLVNPGTRVYLHQNGRLWVYRYGSLQVNGTADDPVRFQGDRLEHGFENDYAQWDRIWINESPRNNYIHYAVIQNAFVGIQVEPLFEVISNENRIENTIIKHCAHTGLIGRAANVVVLNSLISRCGVANVQLCAGNFLLNHVTIGKYYSSGTNSGPAMLLSNYYEYAQVEGNNVVYQTISGNTSVSVLNSIIYGYNGNELVVQKKDNVSMEWNFECCLLKKENEDAGHFVQCLFNKDPLFADLSKEDYTLKAGSPLIGKGKSTNLTTDLNGKTRKSPPDIGAFEY